MCTLDSPITENGYEKSMQKGQEMAENGIEVDHVFTSPSLRCIQTADGLLKGLGPKGVIHMNIEYGLYEWVFFFDSIPKWMSLKELDENDFCVNMNYEPILKENEIKPKGRIEDYYERSFYVMQEILKKCPTGNIMVVAHGPSLDGCVRQLTGGTPQNIADFYRRLNEIGNVYLACRQMIQSKDGKIRLVENKQNLDVPQDTFGAMTEEKIKKVVEYYEKHIGKSD
ncbi:hypothetical protein WR25_17685 [Diploscapter pachys]|uniref:Uncharacterized protein n=1 Tax=Diploscapter pachys TaxID=2018661 RepID=A0A2A2KSH6_9BILA|nr:hypothetical protein WR25_17685 [Diploscapter pachys]